MSEPVIVRSKDTGKTEEGWGKLVWYAGRRMGNSNEMTVGLCVIKPGKANARHHHPNCSEILAVYKGKIRHTAGGGRDEELNEGDVISIPPGFSHRAENIGSEEAVLFISFSSPDRQVVGE